MNGARRFDGDVAFLSTKLMAELAKFFEDHGFAARDNDVRGRPFGYGSHNGFNVP